MLEVPSLLWQLPALLERDRFPVGRHQRSGAVPLCLRPRQSAPRRALRSAVARRCSRCSARSSRNAPRADVPLSMCGEMAGNPLEAMVLIALGFRTLSMTRDRARPGQGDDPQPRRRRRSRAISTRSASGPITRCAIGCEAYARDHAVGAVTRRSAADLDRFDSAGSLTSRMRAEARYAV